MPREKGKMSNEKDDFVSNFFPTVPDVTEEQESEQDLISNPLESGAIEDSDDTQEVTEEVVSDTQDEATPVEQPVEAEQPKVVEEPANRAPAIPAGAIAAERARRQEAEQRAAQLEQHLRDLQRQASLENEPDLLADTQAWKAHMIEAAKHELRKEQELAARNQYARNFDKQMDEVADEVGFEKVQEALEWASQLSQTNPRFAQAFVSAPNPARFMLEQQTRMAEYDEYQRDPEGWAARKLAERSNAAPQVAAAHAKPKVEPQVSTNSVLGMGTGTKASTNENASWDDVWARTFKK